MKKKEVKKFTKELDELLKKYSMTFNVNLTFPEYKVLPVDVQLALLVISKHKNVYKVNFVKEKETNDNKK